MTTYTQFGYGSYPTANQLLGGGNIGQPSASSIMSHNAPSPMSGAGSHENSLSPSGGSTASSVSSTGTHHGALSPGALSQHSSHNAAGANGNGLPLASVAAAAGPTAAGGNNLEGSAAAGAAGGSLVAIAGGSGGGGAGGGCCENGRPIMTDPVSGQTVCSCQYDSARLALSSYSRMPTSGVGVYGTAYPSTDQNPYPSIGVDSSAFYSPLSNPYTLKESSSGSDMSAWSTAGLQPTTGYYSYDPTFAYGYGASYDLASRRKNATRESTATLKAWLNEHKKNPYPTKGEKIMLAIITKMTLTQVSTWFANARRRLKKENKMTWEPKNRTEDDDDDAMLSDDEKELDKNDLNNRSASSVGSGSGVATDSLYGQQMRKEHDQLKGNEHSSSGGGVGVGVGIGGSSSKHLDMKHGDEDDDRKPENLTASRQLDTYNTASLYGTAGSGGLHPNAYHPYQNPNHAHAQSLYYQQQQQHLHAQQQSADAGYVSRDECGIPIPATKPKIWSVADTVANKTPPPSGPGQHQQHNPYLNGGHAGQQQPQQQQQQHAMPPQSSSYYANNLPMNNNQIAHNSPLSMMSNYVNASPYSRLPAAGYASAGTAYAQMNPATAGGSAPAAANMMHPMAAVQQQYNAHNLQSAAQGRLGYPEIQPDTPPQTPPNVKHANVAMSATALMGNTPPSALAYAANLNTSYGSDVSSNASRAGLEM